VFCVSDACSIFMEPAGPQLLITDLTFCILFGPLFLVGYL